MLQHRLFFSLLQNSKQMLPSSDLIRKLEEFFSRAFKVGFPFLLLILHASSCVSSANLFSIDDPSLVVLLCSLSFFFKTVKIIITVYRLENERKQRAENA
jgi:hypothetical protein